MGSNIQSKPNLNNLTLYVIIMTPTLRLLRASTKCCSINCITRWGFPFIDSFQYLLINLSTNWKMFSTAYIFIFHTNFVQYSDREIDDIFTNTHKRPKDFFLNKYRNISNNQKDLTVQFFAKMNYALNNKKKLNMQIIGEKSI